MKKQMRSVGFTEFVYQAGMIVIAAFAVVCVFIYCAVVEFPCVRCLRDKYYNWRY